MKLRIIFIKGALGKRTRCGDGVLQSQHEACDDGNRKNGDNCDANCNTSSVR